MNRRLLILVALTVVVCAANAFAYVPERTSGGAILHWDLTRNDAQVSAGFVIYHINTTCATTIDVEQDCYDQLNFSFDRWTDVLTSEISFLDGGNTAESTPGPDGYNLIVFENIDFNYPTGVIAVTTTYFDGTTGEISDTDIEFNERDYNYGNPASPIYIDLETVATHEIGHVVGLDHSFVGYVGSILVPEYAALMYPYYQEGVGSENLRWDDAAGASFIYSEPAFSTSYGIVSGSVRNSATTPGAVLGANIVLLRPADGTPVLGAVTSKDGKYAVEGVPPGDYVALCVKPDDPSNWGSYYSTSPTKYDPVIYDAHALTGLNQALPGQAPFDTAEMVHITAETTIPNINFQVNYVPATPPPPPPPVPVPVVSSSGGGGSSGGCEINREASALDTGWLLFMLIPIFGVKMLKNGRKAIRP